MDYCLDRLTNQYQKCTGGFLRNTGTEPQALQSSRFLVLVDLKCNVNFVMLIPSLLHHLLQGLLFNQSLSALQIQ